MSMRRCKSGNYALCLQCNVLPFWSLFVMRVVCAGRSSNNEFRTLPQDCPLGRPVIANRRWLIANIRRSMVKFCSFSTDCR